MRFRILPYKMGSKSCKSLADILGGLRIRHDGSYIPRNDHCVINWGCSNRQLVRLKSDGAIIKLNCGNYCDGTLAVETASNKLLAFRAMDADSCVPWTEDKDVALEWLSEGSKVVCRTMLRGHSGNGIVIAKDASEVVSSPLYTKYVKKTQEYRVHVFKSGVMDVQRKMKKNDCEDPDWEVRNLAGGFIYGREGVNLPPLALSKAVMAVSKLGLDFGAVDLIHNERSDRYYVLEVNTACGLEGSTVEKYGEIIKDYTKYPGTY